jgi:hypothetical protein
MVRAEKQEARQAQPGEQARISREEGGSGHAREYDDLCKPVGKDGLTKTKKMSQSSMKAAAERARQQLWR